MKIIGPVDAVFEKQVAELETIISTEMVYDLAIGTGYIGSTCLCLKKLERTE